MPDGWRWWINVSGTPIRILDPLTLALVAAVWSPRVWAGGQLGNHVPDRPGHRPGCGARQCAGWRAGFAGGGQRHRFSRPDLLFESCRSGKQCWPMWPSVDSPRWDEDGAMSVAYHAGRGTLFVLRVIQQPGSRKSIPPPARRSRASTIIWATVFNTGSIAVHPTRNTLVWAGPLGRNLLELDPDTGRVVGPYDPISNTQLSIVDSAATGASISRVWEKEVTGLAFNASGGQAALQHRHGPGILTLTSARCADRNCAGLRERWPAEGRRHRMGCACSRRPNARQRIRILGQRLRPFHERSFSNAVNSSGDRGFISVRADVVSAGWHRPSKWVVPDEAVTGQVRDRRSAGQRTLPAGSRRRFAPYCRPIRISNFDDPVEGIRWGMLGKRGS